MKIIKGLWLRKKILTRNFHYKNIHRYENFQFGQLIEQ